MNGVAPAPPPAPGPTPGAPPRLASFSSAAGGDYGTLSAKDLAVGASVSFEGEVLQVQSIQPLSETGPDGNAKLQIVFEDGTGGIEEYVATASEEFNVVDSGAYAMDTDDGTRRAGVSAAPVDKNKISNWKKTVVPKTDQQKDTIRSTVSGNVFFAHLDASEMQDLIDVVFPKESEAGDVLMREGDEGDVFYILEEGEADIYVNDGGTDKLVRSCKKGDTFGELALMYDAPRNATIKCKTKLKSWCMDRDSFNGVIMGASMKRHSRVLEFLDQIAVFQTMDKAEKMKIVDALIPRTVKAGTEVMKQGDVGDMFYIVESGKVIVKQLNNEGKEEVVNEKGPGAYFGEISLLYDQPRSATVVISDDEDSVLLTLTRKNFINMLGPMKTLLKRKASLYKTYVKYPTAAPS